MKTVKMRYKMRVKWRFLHKKCHPQDELKNEVSPRKWRQVWKWRLHRPCFGIFCFALLFLFVVCCFLFVSFGVHIFALVYWGWFVFVWKVLSDWIVLAIFLGKYFQTQIFALKLKVQNSCFQHLGETFIFWFL